MADKKTTTKPAAAKAPAGAKQSKADKQAAARSGSAPSQPRVEVVVPKDYQPRMATVYTKKVRPELTKQFSYSNPMMVPKIQKIVINMGVGKAWDDKKLLESAMTDMRLIAGQQPVETKARKSIATFKIREGMSIGCKVTLRGPRMWEFLDRLITIALPRVRDFDGVSTRAFDGRGNYALGIKEQIIFNEIDFDQTDRVRGMDVIICTSAKSDDEARALLAAFGMPFRKTRQQIQDAQAAAASRNSTQGKGA